MSDGIERTKHPELTSFAIAQVEFGTNKVTAHFLARRTLVSIFRFPEDEKGETSQRVVGSNIDQVSIEYDETARTSKLLHEVDPVELPLLALAYARIMRSFAIYSLGGPDAPQGLTVQLVVPHLVRELQASRETKA